MKKHRVIWSLLALVLCLVLMLAFAGVALAATGDEAPPGGWSQLWGLLVSVAVPFVTGLLVRKNWPKWSKALIAMTLAGIVGVVTVYLTGNWTGEAALIVLACYGAAQGTFVLIVDKVPGLKDWLLSQFGGAPEAKPKK